MNASVRETAGPVGGQLDEFDVPAFWVAGPDVVSKSNYRHNGAGGRWQQYSGFERALHAELRRHRPAAWRLDEEAPLAQRPVVVAAFSAVTTVDAANLPKSVADAAEGVCYANDASLRACLPFVVDRRRDSVLWCGFAQLEPDSSWGDRLDVVAALARRGLDALHP